MKSVINGKVYNTETATEIASDSYGHSGDFNAWEETLYRTKKGAFFLYGWGGASTSYAERVESNSWSEGSKIEPLTKKEALAWCEEHQQVEAIEAYFADLVEEA